MKSTNQLRNATYHLRKEKFNIYASSLNTDSKNLYELDFTKKTAIVFGNEHRGLSKEAEELADERFLYPDVWNGSKPECFCICCDYHL